MVVGFDHLSENHYKSIAKSTEFVMNQASIFQVSTHTPTVATHTTLCTQSLTTACLTFPRFMPIEQLMSYYTEMKAGHHHNKMKRPNSEGDMRSPRGVNNQ